MPAQPATTETLVDFLGEGFWHTRGHPDHAYDSPEITVNLTALSKPSLKLARAALDAWEAVADLDFVEVTRGGAQMMFDDPQSDEAGTGYDTVDRHVTKWSRVHIGMERITDHEVRGVGSLAYKTYIHEIGHALGLGHGGPYNGKGTFFDVHAAFQNDSWKMTVMSYFDANENTLTGASYMVPITPMMADILAIQRLYGAPEGGATAGDTAWGLGGTWGLGLAQAFSGKDAGLLDRGMTIYDEGGIDTLDLSNDRQDQVLDLRDGAFSSVYGEVMNLAIAPGTVVENLAAGRASDQVTGNAAANVLALGGGDDEASGLGGRDVILGKAGNDVLAGGSGNDTLSGGRGHDIFIFDEGQDTILTFEARRDTIRLDRDLWGGKDLSKAEVLARFGQELGDDVLFDFGQGRTLLVEDFGDLQGLQGAVELV